MIKKLIYVFWEPAVTFESIKEKCNWIDVLLPILLVSIATWISIPHVTPISIEAQKEYIESSSRLSDVQKEAALEKTNKGRNPVLAYIFTPVTIFLKYLIIALVMWFAGNFILGGEAGFVTIFAMTAYSSLIDLIATVIKVPLIVSQQSLDIYTSLALFFNESQTFLFRLMKNIDVFAAWKVILLSMGLSVIYKAKIGKSFYTVSIIWLIYCVIASALGGLLKV